MKNHMRPYAMWASQAKDSAIRRLARDVVRIDRLIRVARADEEGHPGGQTLDGSGSEDLVWLANAAERLRIADAAPKPILMGRHLIELGYKPSAQFKLWLDACFEAQLDGVFSDLDGALAYFEKNCNKQASRGQ